MIKFEATRIHFLSDVFLGVTRHCEFQLQSFGDPQAANRVITVRFITIALQQTYFFLFPKGDKNRC